MRSMTIVTYAVLALAAAALPLVGPTPKADAAPASRFAGSYVGDYLPGGTSAADFPGVPFEAEYRITISANGKVAADGSGSAYYQPPWDTDASGSVGDTGRLSIGGTETRLYSDYWSDDPVVVVTNFRGKATMSRNADGSLSGVESDGTTFVWRLAP